VVQCGKTVLTNMTNICTLSEKFRDPTGLAFCSCFYKPFISIFMLEFIVFYLLIPWIVGSIVFALLSEWRLLVAGE
jgi:hypothetical protein